MYIKEITLNNFRNYEYQNITFNKNFNIFYGENAQGKTNIIEALFLAAFGKSFRTNKDKEMIKLNEREFTVDLNFSKKDRDGKIKINMADKKNIKVNGIKIKRLSELLGKINIVIFTPDDIRILKDGPQKRRKFLDILISQLRPNYIYNLNMYTKTVEQRNNYLRQIKVENKDESLLEIWDNSLAEYAIKICNYRKEYIQKLQEKVKRIHSDITNNTELLNIEYKTECEDKYKYLEILKSKRTLDIIKGYTTKGIHRDDFITTINNKDINTYGSQGQNRSAILSLKTAELEVIEQEVGEKPILLLDDFMSELDKNRRINFLKNITDTQIIITCTENINLKDIEKDIEYSDYHINGGEVYNVYTYGKR